MKKTLLSSAALLCVTFGAHAADLAARFAPPPAYAPAPIFTWTGLYVGAQVGAGWLDDRLAEYDVCVPSCVDRATGRSTGVIGGGHVGYNWLFGWVVAGVEGDFEGTTLSSRAIFPLSSPDSFGSSIQWQSSVRGRLGYVFNHDRILVYGTGGAAFAEIKHDYIEASAPTTQSLSALRTGWTAGGGVEYALTTHWTARAEYRYTDFGNKTDVPAIAFPRFIEKHAETEQAVRVGASYKFW